jgi:flagellar protein FlaG
MDIRNAASTATGIRPVAESGLPTRPASEVTTQKPVSVQNVKAVSQTAKAERVNPEKKAGSTPLPQTAYEQEEPGDRMREVREAMESLARSIASAPQSSNLRFAIDEELGNVVVKVIDTQTQETIKQFPSEEAIALAKSLNKIDGILHQTKA